MGCEKSSKLLVIFYINILQKHWTKLLLWFMHSCLDWTNIHLNTDVFFSLHYVCFVIALCSSPVFAVFGYSTQILRQQFPLCFTCWGACLCCLTFYGELSPILQSQSWIHVYQKILYSVTVFLKAIFDHGAYEGTCKQKVKRK